MEVSYGKVGGFQIIHLNKICRCKPTILGHLHLWTQKMYCVFPGAHMVSNDYPDYRITMTIVSLRELPDAPGFQWVLKPKHHGIHRVQVVENLSWIHETSQVPRFGPLEQLRRFLVMSTPD